MQQQKQQNNINWWIELKEQKQPVRLPLSREFKGRISA